MVGSRKKVVSRPEWPREGVCVLGDGAHPALTQPAKARGLP